MDTRLLQQATTIQDNPLEHNLGFFDFGKYHKAPSDAKYAFDKVGDLLDFELESDDESDEEEMKDVNDDKQEDGDRQAVDFPLRSENSAQPASSTSDKKTQEPTGGIDTARPKTLSEQRRQLEKAVKASKDKLFIVMRPRPNRKLKGWYLVQVDEDETNWRKAKSEGVYHVRFYIRAYADSKKMKVKECAYWPEIHEFKKDGETMGPIVPTKPDKVERLLKDKPFRYMWYQDSFNLFDSMLVGPFDFETGFKIPKSAIDELLSKAENLGVYVGALDQVVPLDKPDTMDRDDNGVYGKSHLALRWNILDGGGLY